MTSEKEEFTKFFQKYGVVFDSDPSGLLVGEVVFVFELGRFKGVRGEDTGHLWPRTEHLDIELINELIQESEWVVNEKGIAFSYPEDLWLRIPVSLQTEVDRIIKQIIQEVYKRAIDVGFDPKRWENVLATPPNLFAIKEDFLRFVNRTLEEDFLNQDIRQYISQKVIDELAPKF